MAGVEVQGLEEALQALELAIKALEPRETEKTLLEGAVIIRDEADSRVPVKEGRLKKALKAKIGRRRGRDFASAIAATDRKISAAGHLVEFGHLLVKGGKLGEGGHVVGHVPPHPFFRPAFDASKERVLVTITEGLRAKLVGLARVLR
ncbi:MAG TPA: HK97-gp10 family putative phage morphogenesis protein [Symbiobacteriaceae bacterium]|jgi:HK97 gp10 family phage protein